MIQRKNKLKLIQLILLSIGVLALYFTYYNDVEQSKIISPQIKDNLKSLEREEDLQKGDYFYNIEYTGLDFSGNRYLLKSKKALLDEVKPEIIYMESVSAIFYFKDDTTLYIWSEEGIYNNKNLDMEFKKNVKGKYLGSDLFAEKAFYSNYESYLTISENVRVNDVKGNLIADKLVFDITNKKLDITSFQDSKINANVNLNEKRF
tara:strand:+ start:47 stop:661 length:615 start_codon:yes stop_codon:yes gene_type:complete